ncbi:MAG: hypothetical protein ABI895_05205 [Deltaproteobacteria bacterium]
MLGPACCLLLAAFSSSVVEGAIGASGEVAAGRAPLDYAGDPRNSLTFTLVPAAAAQLRTADSTLTFSYTPRIFYRLPNALDLNHPLVLHQVGLDHTLAIGKWLAWTSSAQLAVGQIDYTAAGVVFDPGLVSAVRSSVTDILRGTAETGLKYQVLPTLALNLDGGVEYTTTLDNPLVQPAPVVAADGQITGTGPTVFGSVIPDSFQARGKPGFAVSIGRDTHVGAAAELTYQWFKSTARYLVLSPELDWDTKLGQRTTLAMAAGLAYVWTLEAYDPDAENNSLGGTGNIDVRSLVYRGRGTSTTLGLNAALDWFFDPILGTSQPRAGATATGVIQIGRDWQISPLASFFTLLKTTRIRLLLDGMVLPSDDPLVIQQQIDQARGATNATLLRLELPIDYRISDAASFNFGVRSAFRGRPLSEPGFRLNEQVEIWAFVGLTVRAATSHDNGAWLPL